jgi:uncharacterized protein with GYD domain
MTHYVVKVSSCKMPTSIQGIYRRIAVMEVDDSVTMPAKIDIRSKGVVRIVETWERLHVGKTEKSAFHKALADATSLAEILNTVYPKETAS